jgi:hypothetical protein
MGPIMKIVINPRLSKNFDDIQNEYRAKSHHRWWYRPFIRTTTFEEFTTTDEKFRESWYENWPSGVRYDVRCLDGGAWDRTTNHGCFSTLEEAIDVAGALAEKYKPYRDYCKSLYPEGLSGGYHYPTPCLLIF